ncbi:MAG: outer membrane lipoprotein carrier protein LolA [Bacteroidota bacterium]
MKQILSLGITLFISIIAYSQITENAKDLLDEVSTTISNYDNVYIEFDYTLENKAADVEQKNEGDLTINGNKYKVNFFGTIQIYDGSKTYTIIPENEEVNVSSSNSDDENTITPSKFYSFYKKGYTYNLDKKKQINGKQIQYVKLIPIDSNSDISHILIGIETKSKHIYQIIEIGKNETQTVLSVKKYIINQDLNKNIFVFDNKKYEDLGYIIND